MGKQEKPLTFKQEKFCKYYVDTEGNASEAYRMSYDASKMKPETIWSAASRLLANSKVSARISEIKQQRAKETEVERKTVEKVLMDIVLADPDDLHYVDPVTGKTKMRSPSQLPKRARNALKKIQNNRGVVNYEFNGKTEAARILGAWNGWDAGYNQIHRVAFHFLTLQNIVVIDGFPQFTGFFFTAGKHPAHHLLLCLQTEQTVLTDDISHFRNHFTMLLAMRKNRLLM